MEKGNSILICSDIHGNLPAMKAMVRFIEKEHIAQVICLGDVVGYGAQPDACWQVLEKLGADVIMGNHDSMLIGQTPTDHCSSLGKQSTIWTRNHASNALCDALKKIPFSISSEDCLFIHSALCDDNTWSYLDEIESIEATFAQSDKKFVFYGHTHRPRITTFKDGCVSNDRMIHRSEHIEILRNIKQHYIVNVGSIGQSRDSHTDCCFVVLTTSNALWTLDFHRIPYRRYRAYRAILNDGCGQQVANYLIREKWRRKLYGYFDHGCKWLCRASSC